MARIITKGKRKRFIAVTAVALSVTLSLGVFAACGETETPEEEEPVVSTPTDTQTIKNGNFEFFSEMTEDDLAARRNLIHSPNSWTITTVSPASDTKSGIIDTDKEWNYIAKSGSELTSIDDAYNRWNDEAVTAYDRLKFLDEFSTQIGELEAGSEQRTFFDAFRTGGSDIYSVDYEDVKDLNNDFQGGVDLHEGVKDGDTHVLMLHNYETSDGVLGTATYATSSTTITLKGGTAAEVSVWVRTDKLTHYYEDDDATKTKVEKDGGAYIAVTNTVGGNSSSPQFIIKNINTKSAWEKYTVYIRANTYATTTYRLVLGLGRNTSSDNRLEGVNGYAFFDDIEAKTITATDYEKKTTGFDEKVKSDLNSDAKGRMKDATALADEKKAGTFADYNCTFAFDLAAAEAFTKLDVSNAQITTTKETEGSLTKDSNDIVPDNRVDGTTDEARKSIAKATTYSGLESDKATNGYLKTIFENDFERKFPFYQKDGETVDTSTKVVMLLSTNGAAYTATLPELQLGKDEYMLISFFVKTSKIQTGKTGASITLVEGENKTTISAFDSTTVATVDLDKDNKDIYNGWVQCFFIVKNETEDTEEKTFRLELNYGPTSIVGSKASDYADGYAAFAGFQTMELSKTQANYASTGTYAKSVSLTETVKDTTKFDDVANSFDIKEELSAPANFRGVSSSKDANATDNIVTGLLNKEYKATYAAAESGTGLKSLVDFGETKGTSGDWWDGLFGDSRRTARVATQPLVIYNKSADATAPAYGYTLRTFSSTISANSSQRISLRLKVSAGLHAYVFLYDLSEPKTGLTNSFAPSVPGVTYWYDDEGNIVKGDPTADEFNKKTDILYYLQDNGLYTKAGETNGTYYANLWNFDTDDEGNLVTGGEKSQIVFYRNENDNADTKYYAYRDGKAGNYTYSQPVENLPKDIARYDYTAADAFADYTSVIEITGTAETATTWVEACFYVRTGSDAKTYGLAVWAGDPREGAQFTTIPADGYLFVDSYKNASASNFEAIRDERVSALLENEENRATDPADPTKKLEDKLNSDYALYSTYTFYDSDRYVRYDKSQDTDNIGSPWIDYVQSSYEEGIAWLRFDTLNADTGVMGSEVFLDYSVSEVSVAEHVYDTDEEPEEEEEDTTDSSGTNIWLILSSSLLAIVLIFAIVAIIVRKLYKKHTRGKIKVVKDKPAKKHKKASGAEEPAPTKETPKDDNDPYNE